jgi:hypothetical protein
MMGPPSKIALTLVQSGASNTNTQGFRYTSPRLREAYVAAARYGRHVRESQSGAPQSVKAGWPESCNRPRRIKSDRLLQDAHKLVF